MSDPDQALELFGRILVTGVRDESIVDWDMIIDGRMKDAGSQRIRADMAALAFSAEQTEYVRSPIPKVVDTTLHHLLWTLEQEKRVDVSVIAGDGVTPSLQEASDGLAGELHEWIPRFSSQRYERP